jgi:hypothetical protein
MPWLQGLDVIMDEKTKATGEKAKKAVKDGAKHVWHGVEDAADVVGHGAAGAVLGVADGVETASDATKIRKVESDESQSKNSGQSKK